MKLRLFALACCALALLSCRDDFTLEGPFVDIPLAYGFLDVEDDRHFIRVQKAFLQAGGNAAEIAEISDSLYYGADEATVVLENLRTGEATELERVNGEDFDLDRDEGVFARSPNVLYTVSASDLPMRGGDQVRLTIGRSGEDDAVATTKLLSGIEITRPTEVIRIDNYDRPVLIAWTRDDDAAVYDVRVVFRIRELFPSDPDRNRERELTWRVNPAFVPGGDEVSSSSVRLTVSSEEFYRFLGDNLEAEDDIVRRFSRFDVQVAAAGQEVLDRRTLENANTGITSSQSLPRYSNLEGGLGIFTSNTVARRTDIQLDQSSLDSLRDGVYTRALGFR